MGIGYFTRDANFNMLSMYLLRDTKGVWLMMGTRVTRFLLALAVASLCACVGNALSQTTRQVRHEGGLRTLEIYSPLLKVDRIYKSMEGPFRTQNVNFRDNGRPLLIWILGYRADIVSADGQAALSQEFMCHSNLELNTETHRKIFQRQEIDDTVVVPLTRVATLSQGQLSMSLPEGFGMPIMSSEDLILGTQVLNLNRPEMDTSVRHKLYLDFILDKDLKTHLKPLLPTFAQVSALVERDGVYRPSVISNVLEQTSCSLGLHAPQAGNLGLHNDNFGRRFTGHWVVKPGREVRRTRVTKHMRIPFDTTIHYMAVHLHPFSESLTLRDLTKNKDLWTCHPKMMKTGIGIDEAADYSSREGIAVYKDHEYEVVSVYNNTSGVNQDAMATIFIYLLDKEFKKPR